MISFDVFNSHGWAIYTPANNNSLGINRNWSRTLTDILTIYTSGISVVGDIYDDERIIQKKIFNNTGRNHGTYTPLNTPSDYECHFIQGSPNSPNVNGASQYNSMSLGLGADYDGNYKLQIAILRISSGNPYLCLRTREVNTWNGWMRITADYADSAGTFSGNPTVSERLSVSGTISGNGSCLT